MWDRFIKGRGRKAPGALHDFKEPIPRADVAALSLADLSTELVARLSAGAAYDRDEDLVVAGQLQYLLDSRLDVHLNRFSRRRLYDLAIPVLDRVPPERLRGMTVVDLGCGSLNPLALMFLFLLLGARRGYAIDLEAVQDPARAARALAAIASWLLIDPSRVIGRHAVTRETVLENLDGFDLRRLSSGDMEGIALDRLIYKVDSAGDLDLAEGEADLVLSVSLLEHVDSIGDTLATLRRITAPGGTGHHIVDFIDHRVYTGEVASPFEFLKEKSSAPIVHGSNRLPLGPMSALFEQYGFTVEACEPCRTDPLTEEEHRQFAEPYRSMPREAFTTTCARIVVRRQ